MSALFMGLLKRLSSVGDTPMIRSLIEVVSVTVIPNFSSSAFLILG